MKERFEKLVKSKKFLEHANVFGFQYGTLIDTVKNFFSKKKMFYLTLTGKAINNLNKAV